MIIAEKNLTNKWISEQLGVGQATELYKASSTQETAGSTQETVGSTQETHR